MNTEKITNSDLVLEPDPSRVMEGLRDTGYSFETAVADLIDNSIAAEASKVKIYFDMDPSGAITGYIADDGCGMDKEGLRNAMRYGSQKREDPSSLGKFGLGLKTASTAFCRSLSVLSKGEDEMYSKAIALEHDILVPLYVDGGGIDIDIFNRFFVVFVYVIEQKMNLVPGEQYISAYKVFEKIKKHWHDLD